MVISLQFKKFEISLESETSNWYCTALQLLCRIKLNRKPRKFPGLFSYNQKEGVSWSSKSLIYTP